MQDFRSKTAHVMEILTRFTFSRTGQGSRGHPLAGRSSRHRLSRGEEFLFLPLMYQLVSFDLLGYAPLFSIGRCRILVRTSHPSGSRPWENSNKRIISRPWQLLAPENCRYHAVSKVIGSQILWLTLFGRPTQVWLTAWAYHLIKSSPSCLVFRDGTAANQISWF